MGPEVVRVALTELLPEQLDRSSTAGEWSPRMVVHDLADAEVIEALRILRMLAED